MNRSQAAWVVSLAHKNISKNNFTMIFELIHYLYLSLHVQQELCKEINSISKLKKFIGYFTFVQNVQRVFPIIYSLQNLCTVFENSKLYSV